LTEEQKRVLGKYALEGRLNGLELDGALRLTLQQTLKQLTKERTKFQGKAEVSTRKDFSLHTVKNMGMWRHSYNYCCAPISADSVSVV
jgi:oligopeptidase A